MEGSGDRGAAIWRAQYPDHSLWWIVNLYELSDGRITRNRVFFAPEFEAADWRRPFHDAG